MNQLSSEKGLPPSTKGFSQGELAYERIESLLTHMELRPGEYLTLQAVQERVGLGRTPIVEAVRKLSDDTLVEVRAGRGLKVVPIDLVRERELLSLRRDMERFAIQRTINNASPLHFSQMRRLCESLEALNLARETALTAEDIRSFNELDHRMDDLILAAASEPFLGRTLRPLHTIYRRLGFLFLTYCGTDELIHRNITLHQDVLRAILDRDYPEACKASDGLMDFAANMFPPLEMELDPSLLDASIKPFMQ
ncbi:GntR family transcriptional regulator [Chromohalobacter sp. 296-RDG]|uniref:GntR family transcriptional regulator n=1 Tax=Chromohalobacter sp. 296-RDG TaxID=2994062 RepID=UPI002468A188|nr:GntR family transcriptional regulator [Chromohalobacter sp. 296-RDG]